MSQLSLCKGNGKLLCSFLIRLQAKEGEQGSAPGWEMFSGDLRAVPCLGGVPSILAGAGSHACLSLL